MSEPYPELTSLWVAPNVDMPTSESSTYEQAFVTQQLGGGDALAGTDAEYAHVEVYGTDYDGHIAESYLEDFYYRIHVLPPNLNLGNLASAQSQELYFWNAFFETKTLIEIEETGTQGITLTTPELPLQFKPLQSQIFTLLAGTEGPPVIDASYNFVWDFTEYTLAVTGNRSVTLAFPPSRDSPYEEEFYWPASIFTASKGKEQRMALTSHPMVTCTYSAYVFEHEMRSLDAKIWGWQAREYSVPVWKSAVFLTEKVQPGAMTLLVEYTDYTEFTVGGTAMLFSDPQRNEVVEIAEIASGVITLVRPVQLSWPKRTTVMPSRTMRLPHEVSYRGAVANEKEYEFKFSSDMAEVQANYTWPTTYAGLPLIAFAPDAKANISGSFTRNLVYLSKSYGQPLLYDRSEVGTESVNQTYTFETRKEAYEFLSLLTELRGCCGEFYQVSWSPDVEIASTIAASSGVITIQPIGANSMYADRRGKTHIALKLRNGQVLYRQISSIELSPTPGFEQITVSEVFSFQINVADVLYISFFGRCRFGQEKFKFTWYSREWCEVPVNVIRLSDAI